MDRAQRDACRRTPRVRHVRHPHPTGVGRLRHRCGRDGESAPMYTTESAGPQCEEPLRHAMGCSAFRPLGGKHGAQAGQSVSEGPDLRLASFLPELIRHAPGPNHAPRTPDATASALEGRTLGSAHVGRSVSSTPILQVPEVRHTRTREDEEGPLEEWADSPVDGSP